MSLLALAIFATQTNVQAGFLPILAGEDLTGMEGRLAKLSHTSGVAEILLPTDVADEADYLILEGAPAGEWVTAWPLSRETNCRVKLKGTCNPGDKLALGASDGTDDGKVRTLPAVADTYWVALRAEEKGVDGQLVKCRLLTAPGPVVVS